MSSDLFFDGSVQQAVQAAIEQQKYLVAFVTDERDESTRWQDEFLPDVRKHLDGNAVTLRLIAGSQDASYLASMFPIPRFPTVIIIHQGQLKDYLPASLSKEDFVSRVKKVFTTSSQQPTAATTSSAPGSRSTSQDPPTSPNTHPLSTDQDPAMDPVEPSAAAQLDAYRAAAAAREAARLRAEQEAEQAEKDRKEAQAQARRERELQERHRAAEAAEAERRRLEQLRLEQVARRQAQNAARRASDEAATRQAMEEGNARRKEAAEKAAAERKEMGGEGGGGTKPNRTPAEQQHRDEILRHKAEKEKERKRILAQIETDKADRRHREEARRMNREQARKGVEADEAAAQAQVERRKRVIGPSSSSAGGPDGDGGGETCALQVRLLDGGVVRARFGGASTLKEHVRPWVDQNVLLASGRPGGGLKRVPRYKLKMILTPRPNVTFLPSEEEEKTILELGMAPTATLVVVPIAGSSSGGGGVGGVGGVGVGAMPDTAGFSNGSFWDRVKFLFWFLGVWLSGLWARFEAIFPRGRRREQEEVGRGGGEQAQQEQGERERKREREEEKERDDAAANAKATGVDIGDEARRRREQYYNGNSTAFEARPDEDPKD